MGCQDRQPVCAVERYVGEKAVNGMQVLNIAFSPITKLLAPELKMLSDTCPQNAD